MFQEFTLNANIASKKNFLGLKTIQRTLDFLGFQILLT